MNDRAAARLLHADPAAADFAAVIADAAAVLRSGRLVAFPTETVYGLGADALDAAAVQRIYAAKGRPSFNPLIVHLADASWLPRVVAHVTPLARTLAAAFWPGPLTILLPRGASVPDGVTAGLANVGVRVPAHPVALALLVAADRPIAAPSANAYTRVSPTTAEHVLAQLGDRIDVVLDGGPTQVGIESTVVDATGERPLLLRLGGVSVEAIERVAGPVLRPASVASGATPRPAPGMVERHYAPRARLVPFAASERAAVWQRIGELTAAGERVGLLAFDVAGAAAVCVQQLPRDAAGCARELYAALHELDAAHCTVAFVERMPATAEFEAVADRLARAGVPLR